jgi:hypothetical protein
VLCALHHETHNSYLCKAANFNKKGARKRLLLNDAVCWNKGNEFLIERDGKIVTYGEND